MTAEPGSEHTHRIVDHALGSASKSQRAVALVHVHGGGRDVADDGRLGVTTQGGLQDASQLAVAVRDVATCSPDDRGRHSAVNCQGQVKCKGCRVLVSCRQKKSCGTPCPAMLGVRRFRGDAPC